jgi:protease IV
VTLRSALVVLAVATFVFAACKGRPRPGEYGSSGRAMPSFFGSSLGKIVAIDLSGGVAESSGGGLFPAPASRTFVGLVRSLERAKEDQDTKAVYLKLGTQRVGWAQTEEIARLLAAVREQGKPVTCHADSLGNSATWLLARGCDRIWLSPAGNVDTVGIAAQLVYVKGALDKLEVEADFIAVGKYKSAAEALTREGPSEAARESLTVTIKSIRKNWLEGTLGARKAPGVRDALENGPWSAKEAKARGLVDEVGYESEAIDEIKQRAGVERVSTAFGPRTDGEDSPPDITEIIRALTGADERSGGRPHVAVVVAEGSISMEPGGILEGGGVTAKALRKTLRRLAKEDAVKAVVLRVDSPGGSALASDLIWHELFELGKKKPLVASVGDMAASGGYYLACAARKIVAERTSIVGSIGVVGGKIVLGPALEKHGVNSVTIAASDAPGAERRAAYTSALTRWDDPTRDRMKKSMLEIYDLFLDRVAQGRGLPVDKIKPHAEGRIWSGELSKELGLVDEMGGLTRAIEITRELGELDERAPVIVAGGADSLIETLLLGSDASESAVRAALDRHQSSNTLLAALPSELRAFVGAHGPLAAGESTVAALPYAVLVR